MTNTKKVLIIGGGYSGMCSAITLKQAGFDVDLVEIDENWRVDGAGITVSGPTLRALEQIGVLPQYMASGAISNGVEQRTSDGRLIAQIQTPKVPGTEIQGTGGIMRPVLAKILAEAVLAANVRVKLGVSFQTLLQKENSVIAKLTNGEEQEYDLVIGADGLYSKVREVYFPNAPTPQFTGQAVWRAVVPRNGLSRPTMFLGEHGKVGFSPVSDDEMYLYYNVTTPEKIWVDNRDLLPSLRAILEEFTAPEVRDAANTLGSHSKIMYRPLEGILLPRPWNRGRILLIGDAVHATTPHLASGAGLGIEDAIVLAEELSKNKGVDDAIKHFQNRRWERCRMVVHNSARLGEIEIQGLHTEEHAQIMKLSMAALFANI